MKKRLLLLMLIFSVMFVTACGNGASDNGEATGGSEEGEVQELRFVTHMVGVEGRAEAIQELVDEFNQEYEGKAKVVIDGIPDPQTMYDKNQNSLVTDTVADILHFQYNPEKAERYYSSGKLIDLTPHMDGWGETFPEGMIEKFGTYDEKVMGVPFESMALPIYYNTELFEKAGIEEFPKTWDEFLEACKKLEESGVTPISMGSADNAWTTQILYSYLVSMVGGEDFWSKGFDDPAFLEGAKMLDELIQYTTDDFAGLKYSEYSSYFINEQTAMTLNGPWMIADFTAQGGQEFHDKIGVGTMPAYEGGEGEQGALNAGLNFVLTGKKQSDPKREEYAVAFMKHLTSPENAKKLFLASGAFMEASSYEITEEDGADRIAVELLNKRADAPYTFDHLINSKDIKVQNEFPVAVSAMALDEITPEEFVKRLEEADSAN